MQRETNHQKIIGLKLRMYSYASPPFFFKLGRLTTLQHDYSVAGLYHISLFSTTILLKMRGKKTLVLRCFFITATIINGGFLYFTYFLIKSLFRSLNITNSFQQFIKIIHTKLFWIFLNAHHSWQILFSCILLIFLKSNF